MKVLCILALFVCYVAAAGRITGGWERIDTNDEDAQRVAKVAAEYASKQFSSRYHHRLVDVISARRQVVAGLNYEVKIELRETKCSKDDYSFEDAAQCEEKEDSIPKYCTVRVWEKSWENYEEVKYIGCTSVHP